MEALSNVWVRDSVKPEGGTVITALGLVNSVITSSGLPRVCTYYRMNSRTKVKEAFCFVRYRTETDPLTNLLISIELLMSWCMTKKSFKVSGQRLFDEYVNWPMAEENDVLKRFIAAAGTTWRLGSDSMLREPEDTEKTGVLRQMEMTMYVERLVNGEYEQIGKRWLLLDKHTYLEYIDQMAAVIEDYNAKAKS